MGTKRIPEEEKITTFFQTAEAVIAIAMYTAVKSILLSRGFELDGRKTAQKKSKEPKAAGKKQTLIEAVHQGSKAADNALMI